MSSAAVSFCGACLRRVRGPGGLEVEQAAARAMAVQAKLPRGLVRIGRPLLEEEAQVAAGGGSCLVVVLERPIRTSL